MLLPNYYRVKTRCALKINNGCLYGVQEAGSSNLLTQTRRRTREPLKNNRFPGFSMSSGILQKYPLSTAKNLATTELLPSFKKAQKKRPGIAPRAFIFYFSYFSYFCYSSTSSGGCCFAASSTSGKPARDVSILRTKATPLTLSTRSQSISEKAAPTAIIDTAVCANVFTARISAAFNHVFHISIPSIIR